MKPVCTSYGVRLLTSILSLTVESRTSVWEGPILGPPPPYTVRSFLRWARFIQPLLLLALFRILPSLVGSLVTKVVPRRGCPPYLGTGGHCLVCLGSLICLLHFPFVFPVISCAFLLKHPPMVLAGFFHSELLGTLVESVVLWLIFPCLYL